MTRVVSAVDFSSFTTDAKFRAVGVAINALLATSGLVQTSDTGQINWTTVVHPASTNNSAGYEIWRFNDSLQSTTPIFIRLDYAAGNISGGGGFGMWVQVGSGTNGAGTLTGLVTSGPSQAGGGFTPGNSSLNYVGYSNTSCPIIATHTEGYAMFHGDAMATGGSTNATNMVGFFFVDRHRNQTTGAAIDGGWTLGMSKGLGPGTSAYLTTWTVNTLTGYSDQANLVEGVAAPSNQASGWGNRLFPFYTSTPTPSQGIGCIGFGVADLAYKSTFTCYPIGNTVRHTYIVLAAGTGSRMGNNVDVVANTGLALLWED